MPAAIEVAQRSNAKYEADVAAMDALVTHRLRRKADAGRCSDGLNGLDSVEKG